MKIVCFDRFFDKDAYALDNAVVHKELVRSFSQYGEDLVIDGIFENQKTGFLLILEQMIPQSSVIPDDFMIRDGRE